MSEEEQTTEKPFFVDRAKQSRAACKKCKEKCLTGNLRIAKLVPSPYGGGKMKHWFHVDCIFEQFLKQRPTTKRIESGDDVYGWEEITAEDQEAIFTKIEECDNVMAEKTGVKPKIKKAQQKVATQLTQKPKRAGKRPKAKVNVQIDADAQKMDSFREFRKLVADVTNINSYIEKTATINKLFTKGTDGNGFKGDIKLWCRLLLPGVVKRIYNLQSKQLIKLFSKIFKADQDLMLEHLEQGDIGETIQHFFNESTTLKPAKSSTITLQEVDKFLDELSALTKEDEQIAHFKNVAPACTSNDLKIIIRLIKHDLRMNAGAKHVLDGVHPDAYEAYQSSRDLGVVLDRCLGNSSEIVGGKKVTASISIGIPVLPMLAEACKSVEQAMNKCPNGMYSEIKYDGERVQVHKNGKIFKYFSRSLKPVLEYKVAHFRDFIPKAFPRGEDLILDSEILLVDTKTGKPLPFGTLGVHKHKKFADATVCLFVFDCIYFNGEDLTKQPISLRKRILKENMTEIPNHVVLSEMEEIHTPQDLSTMIAKVLKMGLEGLVLKDLKSIYEPGKRHWLKVKKDYLFEGAMADSADLIVLGAWYGTGKKGGMMSVFLMGCYDPYTKHFLTVTKVHTGHDDKTLEKLQSELDMVKISGDVSKVPNWLDCTKAMTPDFVAKNPKMQPVWEITGAEFTMHDIHTANGISIRFPRVTKIRDDKTWEQATTLQELELLFKNSKENTDVELLLRDSMNESSTSNENTPKRKCDGDSSNGKFKRVKRNNSLNNTSLSRKLFEDDKLNETTLNHSSENTPSTSTTTNDVIKNPIPDFFKDVRLLIEDSAKINYTTAIRYFVAYGGTVIESSEWEQATHVLHLQDTAADGEIKCPVTARHVIVEWIKETVTRQSLQDYRPYTVRLQPVL